MLIFLLWKEIGKIGIGTERQKHVPFEVINAEKEVFHEPDKLLDEWKEPFSNLLNPERDRSLNESNFLTDEIDERTPSYLNEEEVLKGLINLKCNKAAGFDNIPAEVVKCQRLQSILCVLFNRCFMNGGNSPHTKIFNRG